MKIIYLLFFFLLSTCLAIAQLPVERKVIIENDTFYFASRDQQSGMVCLYVGSVDQSISKARKYNIPWGRHDEYPELSFQWDINKDTFYCINTIRHSQNDQFENVKKVSLKDLEQLNENANEKDIYILNGIDQFGYFRNTAHELVVRNHKYLDTYFSDMAVDENGRLILLNHVENRWRMQVDEEITDMHEALNMAVSHQPLLFSFGPQFYIIQEGHLVKIDENIKPKFLLTQKISKPDFSGIIIINRDEKSLYTFSESTLNENISLTNIIKLSAQKIL